MRQSQQIRNDLGPKKYDFYRCYKCGKLITREEELEFYEFAQKLGDGEEDLAILCSCGSMKIIPAVPSDDEWKEKNVLRYSVKIVLARGLIPWLTVRFPRAIPLVDWLLDKELLSRYDWLAWQVVKRNING